MLIIIVIMIINYTIIIIKLQRTTGAYPGKAMADIHIAHCTVSKAIAELFHLSPKLVSIAVNFFCLPAASGSNKNFIAVMQRFGK